MTDTLCLAGAICTEATSVLGILGTLGTVTAISADTVTGVKLPYECSTNYSKPAPVSDLDTVLCDQGAVKKVGTPCGACKLKPFKYSVTQMSCNMSWIYMGD